jgi:histidine ammonia-lyase
MNKFLIGGVLSPEKIYLASHSTSVELGMEPSSLEAVKRSRDKVEKIINGGSSVYGINTGFGSLSNVSIEKKDISSLQVNLIRSHACGIGAAIKKELARAMMVLRAHNLSLGYSGVREDVINSLIFFLNNDITPVIPEKGSVGSSGDLAPLAHLSLCLIGEGDVIYKGEKRNSAQVIKELGGTVLQLSAKEGLALINGTQFMTAHACLGLIEGESILDHADIISAMTVEGVKGSFAPFDKRISQIRPHPGQIKVSKNLLELSEDSEIARSHKDCKNIQDPYSLRCIPQVHGASRDAFSYFRKVVDTEINSVTDNPLIFEDAIISGGNFHGQPIAMALDFACIALAELGNISERRIDKILCPEFSSGLSAYLVRNPGLNSGFMIAQYTAASLVNENKVLSFPACVDSIPTSNNKEDHVSMGATSARKFMQIMDNVESIIAIELLVATEACEQREPLKPSKKIKVVMDMVRSKVKSLHHDRVLSEDIVSLKEMIRSKKILSEVKLG